jgi:hypothetical protein
MASACLPIPDFSKGSRRDYVAAHPELTQEIKVAIMNREVVLDMTETDVVTSIGHPIKINRDTYAFGERTQFVYEDYSRYVRPKYTYVYFKNRHVTSWSQ